MNDNIKNNIIKNIDFNSNIINNEKNNKCDPLLIAFEKDGLRNYISNLNISQEMKYMITLFINYCNTRNIDPNPLLLKLINLELTPTEFISIDENFYNWMKAIYNMRYDVQRILLDRGISLDNENLIELYKGLFDTIVSTNCQIVSPYASTLNQTNKIIHNEDNQLYIIDENGSKEIVSPNSTFLINNYNSLNELLYILNTLAETNNYIYFVQSGIKGLHNRKFELQVLKDLLQKINLTKGAILDYKIDELNTIYVDHAVLDANKIKKFLDIETLITENELHCINGKCKRRL